MPRPRAVGVPPMPTTTPPRLTTASDAISDAPTTAVRDAVR
jgi:hypothetical protein